MIEIGKQNLLYSESELAKVVDFRICIYFLMVVSILFSWTPFILWTIIMSDINGRDNNFDQVVIE